MSRTAAAKAERQASRSSAYPMPPLLLPLRPAPAVLLLLPRKKSYFCWDMPRAQSKPGISELL